MPVILDETGGVVGTPYLPPPPLPPLPPWVAPPPPALLPPLSALPGPAGHSIGIPTGPVPDLKLLIENDPTLKQQLQWLTDDTGTTRTRTLADQALGQQLYNLAVQQANQSASGAGGYSGDYGLLGAQQAAALQKEVAAHDDALRKEQLNEIMASRGMYDSGQRTWEQQEREYDLSTLLKSIEIDLAARTRAASDAAGQASAARASAQQGLVLQLQEMALRHQGTTTEYGYKLEDLQTGLARGTGEIYSNTYQRLLGSDAAKQPLKPANYDAASGLYWTSDGEWYDANKNRVPAPGSAGAQAGAGAAAAGANLGYPSVGSYSSAPGSVGYRKPLLEY